MAKAICFDLFSTLVDVGSVPVSVGALTADVLGIDHDTWRAACFSDRHEICQPTEHFDVIHTLAHSIDTSIDMSKIIAATTARQQRFDYALESHIEAAIFQGLAEIRKLGLQLILISNASTAEVRAWQDTHLASFFDVAVFSCKCGLKKPDSAIYQHATGQLGLSPQDCIYVGDGGSDEFVGAAALGIPVLMMTRYLSEQSRVARYKTYQHVITATVESLSDVVIWIKTHASHL